MKQRILIPVFNDRLSIFLVERLAAMQQFEIFITNEELTIAPTLSRIDSFSERIVRLSQHPSITLVDLSTYDVCHITNAVFLLNPVRLSDETLFKGYLNVIRTYCRYFSKQAKTNHPKLTLLSPRETRRNCEQTKRYFALERLLINSFCPFTILRSDLIFGFKDDVLTFLEQIYHGSLLYPAFFKNKSYAPICVDDLFTILRSAIVDASYQDTIVEAVGPENYVIEEIFRLFNQTQSKRRFKFASPAFLNRRMIRRLLKQMVDGPNYYLHYFSVLAGRITTEAAKETRKVDPSKFTALSDAMKLQ